MLFARVYLPLALGYSISYFFRNANAIIEGDLVRELGLGPADLGLLTSVYFISFAAFQLPLGVLLDRYGPRRTEAVLLLFAALGAGIFSQSDSLSGLIVGRLLIGLGVSACLMAAFKAYVLWFSNQRLPLINGLQMVAGGLGALGATTPLQEALSFTDWRGIFAGLAVITLFAAIFVWLVLPEKEGAIEQQPELKAQFKEIGIVVSSLVFWRIAPFAAISSGANMAIHGLWIKPWLRDVAGIDSDSAAQLLFAMTLALIAGFLSLGIIAERMSRLFDIRPIPIGVFCMFIFLFAQGAMVFGWSSSPLILVVLLGFFGSSSILIYAGYAQIFPKNLSGRVSTILNLLVFVSAFFIQWGIGAIIEMWPSSGSGYDPQSYQAAIGVLVLLQSAGLFWYFLSKKLKQNQGLKN
ncbi:MAG: MFS transporter [SAR324 cluster bacterium]|nr:MFS transporter [SAR324 cluster bacterium]MBL7035549.1 MFS transporter [SAR324 cluster bacterium]